MADAVVLPGRMFGPGAGLLMYAGFVAERRGASVHRHWWSREPPSGLGEQAANAVAVEVAGVVQGIGGNPLLIGKSLATLAASVAAEYPVPAVWLTPLLTVPLVADALEQAKAPFMLAGGTADHFWDGGRARSLTPYVVEVDGGDHGMCVPGPLNDSVRVLGRLVSAVDQFLDAIDWPGQPGTPWTRPATK
jgi:hypothetical protein